MYEVASQIANDAVGSIRTVASFCAEEKVMELYEKKCEGTMKKGISQGVTSGIGFGLSFFLLYSVYACSFYAGALLVADGKTEFSNVFQVSSSSALFHILNNFLVSYILPWLLHCDKISISWIAGFLCTHYDGNCNFLFKLHDS